MFHFRNGCTPCAILGIVLHVVFHFRIGCTPCAILGMFLHAVCRISNFCTSCAIFGMVVRRCRIRHLLGTRRQKSARRESRCVCPCATALARPPTPGLPGPVGARPTGADRWAGPTGTCCVRPMRRLAPRRAPNTRTHMRAWFQCIGLVSPCKACSTRYQLGKNLSVDEFIVCLLLSPFCRMSVDLSGLIILRLTRGDECPNAMMHDHATSFVYHMGVCTVANDDEARAGEWALGCPINHSVRTSVAVSQPNSIGERNIRFDTQLGNHETCSGLVLDEDHTLVIKPGSTTMVHVKAVHDKPRNLDFPGFTYVVDYPERNTGQVGDRWNAYISAITPRPAAWHGFHSHAFNTIIHGAIPSVPPDPKPPRQATVDEKDATDEASDPHVAKRRARK